MKVNTFCPIPYVAVCMTLLGCFGCGPKLVLTGRVTLDGEPLAGVFVNLLLADAPEGGVVGSGLTDSKGKYEIYKVLPGKYSVIILKPLDDISAGKTYVPRPPPKQKGGKRPPDSSFLPANYSDPKETELSVKLELGKNTKDFELKSKQ